MNLRFGLDLTDLTSKEELSDQIVTFTDYLGVTHGHIYNLCSRREIPFVKKGKLLYFVPSEIEDWVLQGN